MSSRSALKGSFQVIRVEVKVTIIGFSGVSDWNKDLSSLTILSKQRAPKSENVALLTYLFIKSHTLSENTSTKIGNKVGANYFFHCLIISFESTKKLNEISLNIILLCQEKFLSFIFCVHLIIDVEIDFTQRYHQVNYRILVIFK